MIRWTMGIDPGASGGIAVVTRDSFGELSAKAEKMPMTNEDILDLLRFYQALADGHVFAYLEKVHAFPGQGVSSTFKFGVGFGGLQMALAALKIPHTLVSPQTWQKKMQCLTSGDKTITKVRAQQLFPTLRISHAIADAVLIAAYGDLVREGGGV